MKTNEAKKVIKLRSKVEKLSLDLNKAFNNRVQAVKNLKIAFDKDQIAYIHFEEMDLDNPITDETEKHLVKIEKLCTKVNKAENKFMSLWTEFHSTFDELDLLLGFNKTNNKNKPA
mgnify:CR=1 FL=1